MYQRQERDQNREALCGSDAKFCGSAFLGPRGGPVEAALSGSHIEAFGFPGRYSLFLVEVSPQDTSRIQSRV